jgi:hypothetical protein
VQHDADVRQLSEYEEALSPLPGSNAQPFRSALDGLMHGTMTMRVGTTRFPVLIKSLGIDTSLMAGSVLFVCQVVFCRG